MTLQQRVAQKIAECIPTFELTPGAVVIHHLQSSRVIYMTTLGLRGLGITMQELEHMGLEYHERFFNPEDAQDYVPKLQALLEKNDDQETVSFFQQVRTNKGEPWHWHISGTRIFMHDDAGNPYLTITVAIPIDKKHYFTNKIERLLQENEFLKNNRNLFNSLTSREKEILVLMAKERLSSEIAAELYISEETVKTHRRNIKKKLNLHTPNDAVKFARSFNLV